MMFSSISDTGDSEEKKNPSSSNRSQAYDLLITSPDALPLSYKSLVGTMAIPDPCKPRIWKRYVDDTFTILDRDKVDDFLQRLNSQQPSIRFTMETENNSKIAFLDTSVCREPDSRLTTSV